MILWCPAWTNFNGKLVLVNVSDHMLRCRCDLDTGDATRLVVGILFGVQEGLSIHIVDSVEIKCVIEQDKLQVDNSFVSEKLELTTQVFPDYDLVGWYAVDDVVSDKHMQIHQSLFEFNESPFLMFLDRAFLSEDKVRFLFLWCCYFALLTDKLKDLQVQLFESATKVVNQSPELVFERLNFNIETNPSEKIIVDNAVKGGIDDDMFSSVHSQLMDLRTSVENLLNRLSILIKYLKMFKAGEIEGNFDTLRTVCAE